MIPSGLVKSYFNQEIDVRPQTTTCISIWDDWRDDDMEDLINSGRDWEDVLPEVEALMRELPVSKTFLIVCLHGGAVYRNIKACEYFLQQGADINDVNRENLTVLEHYFTTWWEHPPEDADEKEFEIKMLTFLLEKGAADKQGNIPPAPCADVDEPFLREINDLLTKYRLQRQETQQRREREPDMRGRI